MTTTEILIKIVNELNNRCFDESIVTGMAIRPFVLECDGEETCVKFMTHPVLDDDQINNGNDPDEQAWREIIEQEAVDYMKSVRSLTIRDKK